jgi:hypothetical protein
MCSEPVTIAVSYRHEWTDGFGARGWKLDYSLGDPCVIAATAETGRRIPTSVLVHDILDHYLCGLPLSGHRNEAVALVQLGGRTGSSPAPDFAGMVDEDLLQGRVSGELLWDFLPADLRRSLPLREEDGARCIAHLSRRLGRDTLRQRLIARFFQLGEAGARDARRQWLKHGLDYRRRTAMGLALQQIIEQADHQVLSAELDRVSGRFYLTNHACSLQLGLPLQRIFRAAVAAA